MADGEGDADATFYVTALPVSANPCAELGMDFEFSNHDCGSLYRALQAGVVVELLEVRVKSMLEEPAGSSRPPSRPGSRRGEKKKDSKQSKGSKGKAPAHEPVRKQLPPEVVCVGTARLLVDDAVLGGEQSSCTSIVNVCSGNTVVKMAAPQPVRRRRNQLVLIVFNARVSRCHY
eukprot:m.434003 g.434003  ORF g.434003 m.434003 type:complete len:175 (-) comp20252_c0_seq16:3104-3628(-)